MRGARRGEAVVVFGKTDTSSVDSRNLGPGGATFTGPRGTGVSVQPAGDFSGDGRPDFSIQTPVGVSVVLGADSLGGGRIQRLGRGETLIRRARGYGAAPAALGDFNGDGLADIGVGNHVVHGVRSKREILLDDLEGGGFRIRQTGSFLQGAAPGQLSFAGDPDGDGRAELFVESESAAGVERAYMLDADGLPKVVVAPFRRVIAAPVARPSRSGLSAQPPPLGTARVGCVFRSPARPCWRADCESRQGGPCSSADALTEGRNA